MTATLSPTTPTTSGATAMFTIITTYLDEPVETSVNDHGDIVRFVGTIAELADHQTLEVIVYDGATPNEIMTLKQAAEELRDGTFNDTRFVYEGGNYHLDVPTQVREMVESIAA